MSKEWPRLQEAGEYDAETERLAEEVLPVERIELKYGIDIFALRRQWIDSVFNNPGELLGDLGTKPPLSPGVCMAVMGMCPLGSADTLEAAEMGSQFLKEAAGAARHIPIGLSYKEIGGMVPSRFTKTATEAMHALIDISIETIPVREAAFRERQKVFHARIDQAGTAEKEEWQKAA